MLLGLVPSIIEREISSTLTRRKVFRNLYGDRQLVQELDIVAELPGHTGCVNALCWSKSGRLLASGSDDQHINIHAYQSETSEKQFQLHTTVATGHTANIFSVKFMPHSNDRTVISCAGDGEVRIFDLEYAGKSTEASTASVRATAGRTARQNTVYNGVRYLSDGNTNSRVYRSHADRAKRIVVEESAHLFLTCSEDGEVRQWDLRQPSSYYPRPREGRFAGNDDVPPPLISYRRFNLDLNTISCSASQPHYIALGGAHIHCFLHDRRMTGRDRLYESGKPSQTLRSQTDQDAMDQATRCVRKFAPKGEQVMAKGSRGHITACKISDARPDEMIVSWSNDNIYSFDLIRGPEEVPQYSKLKRKRRTHDSSSSRGDQSTTTLRVSYGNGQQEEIEVADEPLDDEEAEARHITKAVLKIRQEFFRRSDQSLTARFTSVLGQCAVLLPEIDTILREWTYPVNPTPHQVFRQRELKGVREGVRRCIQAVGTISRVLGGQLRTASGVSSLIDQFITIDNRTNDLTMIDHDRFIFDFVKAICAWLDSGTGRLIEVFTLPSGISRQSKNARRLPIPAAEASIDSLEKYLGTYLTHIAPGLPIIDPETSRFEIDATRTLWEDPVDAIDKFCEDASQPFADLTDTGGLQRKTAIEYWCLRIARGLMLQAFQNVNVTMIELAFGGRRSIPDSELHKAGEMESIAESEENDTTTNQAESIDRADNGSAPSDDDTIAATTHDPIEEDDNDDEDDDTNEYDPEDDSSDPDEEDGVPNLGRQRYMYQTTAERERQRRKETVNASVPCSLPLIAYAGAANTQTVKDCGYFGLEDEYIVAGSDDGNFFIWDRKTGEIVNVLQGDSDVVNVVQGHPYEPTLAVSGIDNTVKIFSPDNRAREAARLGATSAQDQSSTSWPHRRRMVGAYRTTQPGTADEADPEDDNYVAPTGLRSRKRFQDLTRILDNNRRATLRGHDDLVITRSMLMHFAQRMREQRVAQGGDPDLPMEGLETVTDEDGRVSVVLGEDCTLM